jgi:hypothetical protein
MNQPGQMPQPQGKPPGRPRAPLPPARPRQGNAVSRPRPAAAPGATRRGPAAPPQPARRPSTGPTRPTVPPPAPRGPATPAGAARARPATDKPRREPRTIGELVPVLVRHAVKRDEGFTVSLFDEKLMPRVEAVVPEALRSMREDVVREYLLEIAHALYLAHVVGQFAGRPPLCGVRAAVLGATLAERVRAHTRRQTEKRLMAARCANLLSGMCYCAVRVLETASLSTHSLRGFAERFGAAVQATLALKTLAEDARAAPWLGRASDELQRRVAGAVANVSTAFGDLISRHGDGLDEHGHEEVLREFDRFLERFGAILDGGRVVSSGASQPDTREVEPLHVNALRSRPAGVEVKLTDGRSLFISTEDARRIGRAAEGDSNEG